MTDQRRSMDPSTLEAILMLRYNQECAVMQVLQESADPLPVRHDADV